MPFPILTENSHITLQQRYLMKDATGQVAETVEELFWRVARFNAKAEQPKNRDAWTQIAHDSMRNLRWLPSSPILMNSGITRMGALAACYVLPIEDDLDDIFDRVKDAATITKQGGGIGYSFSRLRPSGSVVESSGGQASGPVSFIENFDVAAKTVKQGGRRRAAQMGVLRVDHPDILEFIDVKALDNISLANFNLSVAVTDAFMEAVKCEEYYDLIDPSTGSTNGQTLYAPDVWQRLAEKAWVGGDPGVVFLDKANRAHANAHLGLIETPNACSESFMLPWETCILGSLNLAQHICDGHLQYDRLADSAYELTRFLDNTIEVSSYPLPQIEARTKSTRRIGVGVMGLADAMIACGIKYDSTAGIEFAEQIMKVVQHSVHDASETLAQERGPYPAWVGSKSYNEGRMMRNTDPVVIAPTGTISIIAGVSSGIEPLFAVEYQRNVLDGRVLVEAHPLKGQVPDELLRTAHEIDPEWHLKMQAAVQRYTDNAVSKTINMPYSATVDNVKAAYQMAYELDLRSVSIYRDGSKVGQVLVIADQPNNAHLCEQCGDRLVHQDGCKRCINVNCGWTACDV